MYSTENIKLAKILRLRSTFPQPYFTFSFSLESRSESDQRGRTRTVISFSSITRFFRFPFNSRSCFDFYLLPESLVKDPPIPRQSRPEKKILLVKEKENAFLVTGGIAVNVFKIM